MVSRVELDEQLRRPGTLRPVAEHGRRHRGPSQRLGHEVRRDLAPAERAVGEVPQRRLALARLVHGAALLVAESNAREERVVRRARHEAEDLHLALSQDAFDQLVV